LTVEFNIGFAATTPINDDFAGISCIMPGVTNLRLQFGLKPSDTAYLKVFRLQTVLIHGGSDG